MTGGFEESEAESRRRAEATERFIQEKLEAPPQYYGRDAAGNFFSIPYSPSDGDASTDS